MKKEKYMPVCKVTGKSCMRGNQVSHSNSKNKKRFKANIQRKRIFNIESGCFIKIKVSARGLRSLNKKPLSKHI